MLTRAAFLDRDGVINSDKGYVGHWADFEFLPGAIDGMRLLQSFGFALIVVTNQSGIARGFFSEDDFFHLTQQLEAYLVSKGVELTAVYHCPFLADAPIAAYRRESDLRKPEPGMLLRAAQDLALDLNASLMIGDKVSDMQAAASAGVGQRFHVTRKAPHEDCTAVASLYDAAKIACDTA